MTGWREREVGRSQGEREERERRGWCSVKDGAFFFLHPGLPAPSSVLPLSLLSSLVLLFFLTSLHPFSHPSVFTHLFVLRLLRPSSSLCSCFPP